MKQVTASAQTVEEAVNQALRELNTTRDKVEVRIIQEGKKGLFGVFGAKQAIVEVSKHVDPVEETKQFLEQVIDKMGIDISIEVIAKSKEVIFQLSGEKIAILIGKRGQTLNSLQYLTQLVMNRLSTNYCSVILDAEGYRERRKQTLKQLAIRLSEKAIKTNREVKLEAMPSYERKVIHTALQDNTLVHTYSSGEEPNRYVVIKPTAKSL